MRDMYIERNATLLGLVKFIKDSKFLLPVDTVMRTVPCLIVRGGVKFHFQTNFNARFTLLGSTFRV